MRQIIKLRQILLTASNLLFLYNPGKILISKASDFNATTMIAAKIAFGKARNKGPKNRITIRSSKLEKNPLIFKHAFKNEFEKIFLVIIQFFFSILLEFVHQRHQK